MLKKLQEFIDRHCLLLPNDKPLLAVSGGLDSVVMCDMLHKLGYGFGIAHFNFGLRGVDSQLDEAFVKELAATYNADFFVQNENAQDFARLHGVSVQMAARTMRYAWFETLLNETDSKHLATAHHQNDHAETVLLNLARGTGIAGMHGILPKKKWLVRPLLAFCRSELELYATQNQLTHQEDSSNASTKYKRNLLRHKVMPVLSEINPNLEAVMWQNSQKMAATEYFLHIFLGEIMLLLVETSENNWILGYEKLQKYEYLGFLLFEVFKKYGFTQTQTENLAATMPSINNAQPTNYVGKVFLGKDNWQLILEEKHLVLKKKPAKNNKVLIIKNVGELAAFSFAGNGFYSQIFTEKPASFEPKKLYFCVNALIFPMGVRLWQAGDRFAPLGMGGRRKLVSDYVNEQKIPASQRSSITVLIDGVDEIVAVLGYRSAEKTKITNATTQILGLGRKPFEPKIRRV